MCNAEHALSSRSRCDLSLVTQRRRRETRAHSLSVSRVACALPESRRRTEAREGTRYRDTTGRSGERDKLEKERDRICQCERRIKGAKQRDTCIIDRDRGDRRERRQKCTGLFLSLSRAHSTHEVTNKRGTDEERPGQRASDVAL